MTAKRQYPVRALQVRLPADTYAELKEAAVYRCRDMSSLIRGLIATELAGIALEKNKLKKVSRKA